ncbi:MAG TPA: type II secretion system protein [Patescibacteria group bacterium]
MKEKQDKKSKHQFGFTLVELIVTIAIIGILAAIVLVSLNSSRKQGRDVKRVSDARQIMTALQLFFNDNSGYPSPSTASTSGPDPAAGNPTWTTYLIIWPQAPVPVDNPTGGTTCTTSNNLYTYTQLSGGSDYSVTFCLGSQIGQYGAGVHTLSSRGIQ